MGECDIYHEGNRALHDRFGGRVLVLPGHDGKGMLTGPLRVRTAG